MLFSALFSVSFLFSHSFKASFSSTTLPPINTCVLIYWKSCLSSKVDFSRRPIVLFTTCFRGFPIRTKVVDVDVFSWAGQGRARQSKRIKFWESFNCNLSYAAAHFLSIKNQRKVFLSLLYMAECCCAMRIFFIIFIIIQLCAQCVYLLCSIESLFSFANWILFQAKVKRVVVELLLSVLEVCRHSGRFCIIRRSKIENCFRSSLF